MTAFYFHIVFPTYKRLPILLNEEMRDFVSDQISSYTDVDLVEYKVLTDHCHILLKLADADLLPMAVKKLKGRSTYSFYKEFPNVQLDIGRARLWARKYYAVPIEDNQQLENTIRYVRNNYDKYRG